MRATLVFCPSLRCASLFPVSSFIFFLSFFFFHSSSSPPRGLSYSVFLLRLPPSLPLSLGGELECHAVTSLAFGSRKNDWCRAARFNTYLGYLYRFGVAWDVVTFCLLVPLIHTLRLRTLILMGKGIWHLNVTLLGYEL